MHRDPSSHKGDNGTVVVIGGSRHQHGAPLFSALAAEAAGVDLLHVAVPASHQSIARMMSLNFQVHPFVGDDLMIRDVGSLLELMATADCAVIGPGIGRSQESLVAVRSLVASAQCPLVLDASALQPWTLEAARGKDVIATPHLGELERMEIAPHAIGSVAQTHHVVIHVKGPVDHIAADDGRVHEVEGGNAGLTVGGTGDALAGLIAGFRAQHLPPLECCRLASTIVKRAGVALAETRGFSYTAHDVIRQIPHLLHSLTE